MTLPNPESTRLGGLIDETRRYCQAARIFRFFRHHAYIYPAVLGDLIRKKLVKRPFEKPRNVVLKLHSACNARCTFCYARKESAPQQNRLSVAEWKALIREAKALGCYTVTLSGGEPLIYPHLVELVRYVRELRMIPFTTTNGLAATPALLRRLEKAGLCALNFSIQGPRAYHDRVTGIRGAYDQVVGAGRYCAAHTHIVCIINHVATPVSMRNRWHDRLWQELRPSGFRALNLLPICVNSPDTSVLLGPEELLLYDAVCRQAHVLTDTKNYATPRCPAGYEDLLINDCGEVQPCPFIPISFGNAKRLPLKDIFMKIQRHDMFRVRSSVCMPARDPVFIGRYLLPAFRKSALPAAIEELEGMHAQHQR